MLKIAFYRLLTASMLYREMATVGRKLPQPAEGSTY